MGSSGSGKSVLLNILSDRTRVEKTGKLTRNVKINGQPFDNKIFGKVAAYVMQDDILFSTLTA